MKGVWGGRPRGRRLHTFRWPRRVTNREFQRALEFQIALEFAPELEDMPIDEAWAALIVVITVL